MHLRLTGPNLSPDKTVHVADETETYWFTSFGTFRKSDGTWIVDRRFKVSPLPDGHFARR